MAYRWVIKHFWYGATVVISEDHTHEHTSRHCIFRWMISGGRGHFESTVGRGEGTWQSAARSESDATVDGIRGWDFQPGHARGTVQELLRCTGGYHAGVRAGPADSDSLISSHPAVSNWRS